MTVTTFLREMWSTVAGTVGYLLAYRGALVLAILAAALTRWLAAMPRACPMRGTLAGAVFAGFTTPSAKADLASIVRAIQLRSGDHCAGVPRGGLTIHYKLIPEQLLR